MEHPIQQMLSELQHPSDCTWMRHDRLYHSAAMYNAVNTRRARVVTLRHLLENGFMDGNHQAACHELAATLSYVFASPSNRYVEDYIKTQCIFKLDKPEEEDEVQRCLTE